MNKATVNWEPQKYLDHFGSAEKIASLLGLLSARSIRQQILRKKINKANKTYLDNVSGFNKPKKIQKPKCFVVGVLDQEFIDNIKKYPTKYKLSNHYGVRTRKVNAHLNACFGHQDLQKIKEIFK